MLRNRILLILNGSVILVVMFLLFSRFSSVATVAQEEVNLPSAAKAVYTATDLSYVLYSGTTATTMMQPLNANGRLSTQSPQTVHSQPEPSMCETDEAHGSPNGRYLILQYNCEANLFIRLLHLDKPNTTPAIFPRGYFLDWSPDGDWFLFRNIDDDQILLIPADGTAVQLLDLPFGTYGASFAPDGKHIVYAASKGLRFGSEIGTMDLVMGTAVQQRQFSQQIVAYPRWSPDGEQMAYILMPDSNIPYTAGKLWLADTTGEPTLLLDGRVDAGHGYPPAWSPDSQKIAYIHRENFDSVIADQYPHALHSNIYQITIADAIANAAQPVVDSKNSYQATPTPSAEQPAATVAVPLTQFEASLVYDIAWSPDGTQLAFTADDGIWMMDAGQAPVQASPPDIIARHPVWVVSP